MERNGGHPGAAIEPRRVEMIRITCAEASTEYERDQRL